MVLDSAGHFTLKVAIEPDHHPLARVAPDAGGNATTVTKPLKARR